MLKWKIIMFLFGLKTATCSCINEGKKGFENIKGDNNITKLNDLPQIVNESSGLLYDKSKNYFITHNDSGGENDLYYLDRDANLIENRNIKGAKNVDWEDLAQDNDGTIYIGDFGNNKQERKDLKIYKVNGNSVEIIAFGYSDQEGFPSEVKNFDCEAFFWHDGYLYLFTKNYEKKEKSTKLYRVKDQPGSYTLEPIDSIVLETPVTSADINTSGSEFVLLTYGKAYFFDVKEGKIDFSEPKACLKTGRKQTEAIAYINDDTLVFSNEQQNLYQIARK